MVTIISWWLIMAWVNIVLSSLGIIITGWLIYRVVRAIFDETYEV